MECFYIIVNLDGIKIIDFFYSRDYYLGWIIINWTIYMYTIIHNCIEISAKIWCRVMRLFNSIKNIQNYNMKSSKTIVNQTEKFLRTTISINYDKKFN